MEEKLIAPCGINCAVCVAYIFNHKDLNKEGFKKKYCNGCIDRGKGCTFALGKKCDLIKNSKIRFCYECKNYPCKGLKNLDKRYRTKYNMSMIENLNNINTKGMSQFLNQQQQKYACPNCGDTICCHNNLCLNCQLDQLKQNKKHH